MTDKKTPDIDTHEIDPAGVALSGAPLPTWTRAFVIDGVVRRMHTLAHGYRAYFEPEDLVLKPNERIISVDASHTQIGHLVDEKGNTTPAEGRTRPLANNEAAYLAGPDAGGPEEGPAPIESDPAQRDDPQGTSGNKSGAGDTAGEVKTPAKPSK